MIREDTREAIEGVEYPLTTDELIEQCGDRPLGVASGTERVRDALEPLAEETYDTAEEARLAVFTGVSGAAIGRRGYSDRDPTPTGSRFGPDQVSF